MNESETEYVSQLRGDVIEYMNLLAEAIKSIEKYRNLCAYSAYLLGHEDGADGEVMRMLETASTTEQPSGFWGSIDMWERPPKESK